MKRILALVCISGLACSAWADSYGIAKQQAKRAVNQVQERQAETQQIPTVPTTPPPQNIAPPPPNPAVTATLLNISNLAKDLELLQTDPLKKQPLINDLNLAPQGTSPAKTSVSKLTDDLATAVAGKKLSIEQRTKLGQYLRALFNSSHVPPAQQRAVLEDFQKTLQSVGVFADAATTVINDLKAIAAETK